MLAEILFVETRDILDNTTAGFMINFINTYSNRILVFIRQFSLIPHRTNMFTHHGAVILGLILHSRKKSVSFASQTKCHHI